MKYLTDIENKNRKYLLISYIGVFVTLFGLSQLAFGAKVSDYPAATIPAATDTFYVIQGTTSKKIDLQTLQDMACTYLVISDGTNYRAKNCDTGAIEIFGTDGDVAIQYALDNLTASRDYQEKVIVSGDFIIDATIDIHSHTYLDIQGKLTMAVGGIGNAILRNSEQVTGNTNITITGGYLVGEKSRTTVQSGIRMNVVDTLLIDGINIANMENHGMDMFDAVTNFVIQNSVISISGDDGITVHGSSSGGVIFNNTAHGGLSETGSSSGIEIEAEGGSSAPSDIIVSSNILYNNSNGIQIVVDGSTGAISGLSIVNNLTYSNTTNGIVLQGDNSPDVDIFDTTLSGNISRGNGVYGIYLLRTKLTSINGGTTSANGDSGLFISEALYTTVKGLNVIGNGVDGNGDEGIEVAVTSNYTQISNSNIFDNGTVANPAYAIRQAGSGYANYNNNNIGNTDTLGQRGFIFNSTAGNATVKDNNFFNPLNPFGSIGTVYLQSVGAGNIKVSGNQSNTSINHVTEARGSGTISSGTSVAITHGINSQWTMPASAIKITPTNSTGGGSYWVDAIGTSTFTVNGTNGLTFDWEIDGRKQ